MGIVKENSIVEKTYRQCLITTILSTMAYCIGPMVDGMMIGNFLDVDAVAAYGLINPIIFVYSLVGAVIAGGARGIVSRLIGDGNLDEGNRTFSMSLFLSVGVSACMTVLTILFAGQIAVALGAKGSLSHLRDLTADYLIGYAIGIPASNGAKVLSSFMQMDGDGRRVIRSVAAMTIADIIGDLLVILVFSAGMMGMGAATSVGHFVSMGVLLLHFHRTGIMLRLTGEDLPWDRVWEMIRTGLPVGISRLSNTINGLTVNHLLGLAATSSAVAVYGVQRSVDGLFNVFYLGAAETIWVLSGIYYGEEDRIALKELHKVAFRTTVPIVLGVSLILYTAASFFARIYLNMIDMATFEMAVDAVRWLAVALPLLLGIYCFDDYLMGVHRLKEANIYSFLIECGINVPVVAVLIYLLGGRGAWVARPVTALIGGLIALVWILSRKGKYLLDKALLLKDDFGFSAGKELELSVDSFEEVMIMSRLASMFAEENGADESSVYFLGLAVEEMAGNIIQHGFADGEEHSIDIRILVKDEEIILRIRDNCVPFNPKEQYEILKNADDPMKNMGIRMIVRKAKDVVYLNTMNTNNLIIRI